MSIFRLSLGLAALVGLVAVSGASITRADDDKKDSPAKSAAAKDDGDDTDKLLETGDVKSLLGLINALRTKGRDQQKILAAVKRIKEIATDDDKKLAGYHDAMFLPFVLAPPPASPEALKQLVEQFKAQLKGFETVPRMAINVANRIGINTEYARDHAVQQLAPAVYEELATALANTKDEQAMKGAIKLRGAARRLDLLGKPLEISGTLMDGTKFDWASYRGRVVLVDFWATWCGPCRAELPNVKKNYAAYHHKGFDVVGISLDEDRQALEGFLEKEQNPWVTLHDGAWNDNAVATYYGIMGIPTVILVDKQGKVVSTRARGPELGKQLEVLLGPPDAASEKTDAKDDDAVAK